MAIYRLGPMVHMKRKALKLTQEQLVEDFDKDSTEICSTQVLRRIEKGNVGKVKIEIFRKLMIKMGVLPERMYASLLVTDSKVLNLKTEIHVHICHKEYEQAEQKLQKLEEKMVPEYPRNQQYLMERKATLDFKQGKISAEQYFDVLWSALKCTVPMLEEVDIAEWPFSVDEFKILDGIAIAYHRMGKREEELELLLKLKKNIENEYMERNHYVSLHSYVLSRLSQFMCITDQYEKAMEYCEIGIEECRKHNILGNVHRFMYDMAWYKENRIRRGILPEGESLGQEEFIKKEREFCKKQLEQAYYLSVAQGDNDSAERIKKLYGYFYPDDTRLI